MASAMQQWYKILRIERSVSDVAVRSAYRKRALATHPDKEGGSAEEFRRVVAAFETLGDANRRAKYDLELDKRLTSSRACTIAQKHQSSLHQRVSAPSHTGQRVPQESVLTPQMHLRRQKADGVTLQQAEPAVPYASRAKATASGGCSFKDSRNVEAHTSSPPILALVKDLISMENIALRARLAALSESTLREVAALLRSAPDSSSFGIDGGDADPSSNRDSSGTCGGALVQHDCETSSEAVEDCTSGSETTEEQDGLIQPPLFALCDLPVVAANDTGDVKPKRNLRGVIKCNDKFFANVGLENLMMFTQGGLSLDAAIDMHISLVQLLQYARAAVDAGLSFQTAVRQSVACILEERTLAQAPQMKLTFQVDCHWKREGDPSSKVQRSARTRNLDEALDIWSKWVETKSQRRAEVKQRRMAENRRLMAQRTERRRQKEEQCQRKLERQYRREERKRHQQELWKRKLSDKQARSEAQAAKVQRTTERREALSQTRSQKGLLAEVSKALREMEMSHKHVLRQMWGVSELPEGVHLGTLTLPNDCLYMVLQLQDGSTRCGPCRQSLTQVCEDISELQWLQHTKGDAAACAELDRRDVDAMTALFVQQL